MLRWQRALALLLLIVLAGLALTACRHTPDEEQVRAAIAELAHAAEAAAASDVMAPLSDDFDGNAGTLDRRGLGNMIRLIALRGDHVGTTLGPVTVERRDARIVASFVVTLTSGGRLLPAQIGVYQVESAWRNEDGRWRCYSASWKRKL